MLPLSPSFTPITMSLSASSSSITLQLSPCFLVSKLRHSSTVDSDGWNDRLCGLSGGSWGFITTYSSRLLFGMAWTGGSFMDDNSPRDASRL